MPLSENFSVQRIASLARINVPAEQLEQTQLELEKVLEFVKIIETLDLTDIEPFFGMDPLDVDSHHIATRPDTVTASTNREIILENALNMTISIIGYLQFSIDERHED